MVQVVTEVPEAEAEGKIKTVYDDIKSTLHTPVVGLLFRSLAVYPDYLQVAWIALKPNAQTIFFESRADQLGAFARTSLPKGATAPTPPEPARATLDVFRDLSPKMFLVAAALRSAANGQQPRLTELPREEKRQVPLGTSTAESPQLVDPASATGEVADLFRQIESHFPAPAVPCEYRALARWPDYLRAAWQAVQTMLTMPELAQLEWNLRRTAEETVVGLPYRMDTNPHVLRQSGLSEQDLDGVHRVLGAHYRSLPRQVAALALLSR